ncbi:phytosulfokines-like [Herrania umbratica]|uniref:Phytosulfokine n=1 Tax=Herrania umbratica TaxID=108875 RepID=A0A6J1B470_9ROSI|nr:phytosulfokines-like [Herrania umbratica]
MAKSKTFVFLILALLLLSTAQSRLLPTSILQQGDEPQMPVSSPESSYSDDECNGLGGEECLIRRSLAAHTDYIYTQEKDEP